MHLGHKEGPCAGEEGIQDSWMKLRAPVMETCALQSLAEPQRSNISLLYLGGLGLRQPHRVNRMVSCF